MNIFVTSHDPGACAVALDDARLVKAVVEAAQILTTAAHLRGLTLPEGLFKPTHPAHPVVRWVSEKPQNFNWTFRHFRALCAEYTHRFRRQHACERHAPFLGEACDAAAIGEPFTFCNAARNRGLRIDCRYEPTVFECYRKYLRTRWAVDKRPPRWTARQAPAWATQTYAALSSISCA